MSVSLIISFKVKSEKLCAFKEIMSNVKNDLVKVDGCKQVKIFNEIENPLSFTLVEDWESREAHGAHVQNMISSGNWDGLLTHLSELPTSSYFQKI